MKDLNITNKDWEFYYYDMKRYKMNCLYKMIFRDYRKGMVQ